MASLGFERFGQISFRFVLVAIPVNENDLNVLG